MEKMARRKRKRRLHYDDSNKANTRAGEPELLAEGLFLFHFAVLCIGSRKRNNNCQHLPAPASSLLL